MSTFRMTLSEVNTTATTVLKSTSALVQSVGSSAQLLNNAVEDQLIRQQTRQHFGQKKHHEIIKAETAVELYQLRTGLAELEDQDLLAKIMAELD